MKTDKKEPQCPKCGAEYQHTDVVWTVFACGTAANADSVQVQETIPCLRRQIDALCAKMTKPKAGVAKFTGGKSGLVYDYPEGKVTMWLGEAEEKPAVAILLNHKKSENVTKLLFSMNGLAAFLMVGAQIMEQQRQGKQKQIADSK